jgi:regulator of sigma E protease
MALHEFSHFLAAKRSGIYVEEFGIGFPPRIFGKKLGETLYSINLLPLGAFVKIEEKGEKGFYSQPLSKRIIVVLAGVISFWIISFIIFTLLFKFGAPVAISDEEVSDTAKVQIIEVAKNSPAEIAGLKIGDTIKEIKIQNLTFKIEKTQPLKDLIQEHKGERIVLKIERGKETFDVEVIPRVNPPQGQGPIGIAFTRVDIKKYPLLKSIFEGIKTTVSLTFEIIKGYFLVLKNLFRGVSPQVEFIGTIGAFNIMYQTSKIGLVYFFNLLAIISIYSAIFNSLPIPALDGGRFLFLLIEGIRKRPISRETENKITTISFGILVILVILTAIKDISKILKQ